MARFLEPQWFDNNGDPLSGGKLYFYQSGSSTPADTYSNAAESIANPNPVILDASGRPGDIFFSGQRRLVLTDANDVQIEEIDPIDGGTPSEGGGSESAGLPSGATDGDTIVWNDGTESWDATQLNNDAGSAGRRYRFWRMVRMTGSGQSNNQISLTELELVAFDGNANSAVQTEATLTASFATFNLQYLNNGNTSEGADIAYTQDISDIETAGAYYQWDFGASNKKAIVALRQYPMNFSSGPLDNREGYINRFEIEASDDGTIWNKIYYVDHLYSGDELPTPTLGQWSIYYWLREYPLYSLWNYVDDEKTANFTAEAGDYYLVSARTGDVDTVTLPASPSHGDRVGIKLFDFDGTDLTIAGNGNTIDGNASFTLDGSRGFSSVIPFVELTFVEETETPLSYWAVTSLAPPLPDADDLTMVLPEQTANFNALNGNYYFVDLATAGGDVQATLPATPSPGNRIGFMVSTPSGSRKLEVLRNGKLIQSGTLDLDIVSDTDPLSVELIYISETRGWVVLRDGSTYTIAA